MEIDGKDTTKVFSEEDWEMVARRILEGEKTLKYANYPEPKSAMIRWRDNIYIGSIQEIAPEISNEIVLLSKSSQPLPVGLVNAIGKLDSQRLELDADESLDLDGRQHIVRLLENRLVHMTSSQIDFMMKNVPNVYDVNY